MEINSLRYFKKVFEKLNYSKASEEVFVSRQALKQSIQVLEKELGTPLFTTEKNRLYPTRFAYDLYEKIAPFVDEFNKMEKNIHASLPKQSTVIHIGVCSSLFPFFFPELEIIFKNFKKEYPSINVEVTVCSADELISNLDKNTFDVIITLMIGKPPIKYSFFEICHENISITMSRNHPLAQKEKIYLKDLNCFELSTMGNPKIQMYELYKQLSKNNIQVQYKVIENAIDAFTDVKMNDCIMINSCFGNEQYFEKTILTKHIEDFTVL